MASDLFKVISIHETTQTTLTLTYKLLFFILLPGHPDLILRVSNIAVLSKLQAS